MANDEIDDGMKIEIKHFREFIEYWDNDLKKYIIEFINPILQDCIKFQEDDLKSVNKIVEKFGFEYFISGYKLFNMIICVDDDISNFKNPIKKFEGVYNVLSNKNYVETLEAYYLSNINEKNNIEIYSEIVKKIEHIYSLLRNIK